MVHISKLEAIVTEMFKNHLGFIPEVINRNRMTLIVVVKLNIYEPFFIYLEKPDAYKDTG